MKKAIDRDWEELQPIERLEQQTINYLLSQCLINPNWRYEFRRMESWESESGYNGAWFEIAVYMPRKRKAAYCFQIWADAFRLLVEPNSIKWVFGYGAVNTGDVLTERFYNYQETFKNYQ